MSINCKPATLPICQRTPQSNTSAVCATLSLATNLTTKCWSRLKQRTLSDQTSDLLPDPLDGCPVPHPGPRASRTPRFPRRGVFSLKVRAPNLAGTRRPLWTCNPLGGAVARQSLTMCEAGGVVLLAARNDPLQHRIYRYLTNSHKGYWPASFDGARYALSHWPRSATPPWDHTCPGSSSNGSGGGKWQSPPATESSWLRLFPARESPPFHQLQNTPLDRSGD